ncbi:Histone-lysine N-methyltransferase H3 lysine-4 specific, partial [Bienertia sinuspersici]
MARNSKAKSKSSKGKTKKNVDTNVQKLTGGKTISNGSNQANSGGGTVPLNDEGMETPNQDLIPMYQASQSKPNFTEWLTKISNKHPISRIHIDDEEGLGGKDSGKPQLDQIENTQECVKIGLHDIQPELDYWASSVYCYIIGANPPVAVMEGFIKRVWKKYDIDKVIGVKKSLYLIMFKSLEDSKAVLNDEKIFFDSKPIMMKAWTHDADVNQEDFLQCPSGFMCTHIISKLVRVDHTTVKRERLVYARCMIEVKIGQDFPSHVFFIDEHDQKQMVPITYEWRPVQCTNCKGIENDGGQCYKNRKAPTHKTWRPKKVKQRDMNDGNDQKGDAGELMLEGSDRQGGDRPQQAMMRNERFDPDGTKGNTEEDKSGE